MAKKKRVSAQESETQELFPFSTPEEFARRTLERVKERRRKSVSWNIPVPKKRDQ